MAEATEELELEEQFFPTNSALLFRWLPWLRLLGAFRIATMTSCLFPAVVAVWLLPVGPLLMHRLFDHRPQRISLEQGSASILRIWPADPEFLAPGPATRNRVDFRNALQAPWQTAQMAFGNARVVLDPLERVIIAAQGILFPRRGPAEWIEDWLVLLWMLLVFALFGGMISRVAAIESAGRHLSSAERTWKFVRKRWWAYLGAPFTTLAGLGLLWGLNALAGLFARVPLLNLLVGLMWFLVMGIGFLLAVILLGIALGWPLMIAAVSADDSDAFDAMSRAFSYVFNRPWYALFLTVVSAIIGSLMLYVVIGVVTLAVDLTSLSVQSGLGEQMTGRLYSQSPDALPVLPWQTRTGSPDSVGMPYFFEWLVSRWTNVLLSIPAAFVFSYFWTLASLIYLLLRRREDGTPLDEIAKCAGHPTSHSALPLMGMAAARERARQEAEQSRASASEDDSATDEEPSGEAPSDEDASGEDA